jgi:hypothetical protein
MWWFFKKVSEDDKTITYNYSFESKDLTGLFVYDKMTGETTVIKYAINHNERDQKIDPLPAFTLINEYGSPDEKMIAIG